MLHMNLVLRVLAECDGSETALHLGAELGQSLRHWSAKRASEPRQYWKQPELFEFAFILAPPTEASLHAVISAQPQGWSHSRSGTDFSSVWNRSAGAAFLLPEVTWTEIQLYEVAPSGLA